MEEENIFEQSFGKNKNEHNTENLSDDQKNNLLLSKQIKNYQNQILVLTKRIKEYEQDIINKNSKEENQMTEFMKIEINYKNELSQRIFEKNKREREAA